MNYSPLDSNFRVLDPAVVPADFDYIRAVAGERDILLTAIGYPASPTVRGSSTKQADFYSRVIQELARGEGRFVAAKFMSLADLHPSHANALSDHYGLPLTKFRAVLRTMGLFDGNGRPKPAWGVLLESLEVARETAPYDQRRVRLGLWLDSSFPLSTK